MRLAGWLKGQGYGARAKLARATGLTWESIDDIAQGKRTPSLLNALKIQAATGGKVTVAALAAKQQTRKRAASKRKRRRRSVLAAAA